MIRRDEAGRTSLIPQSAHAWLSSQLAEMWGNERFPAPAPRAETLLGIAQHDQGWAAWEQAPTVREDGVPRSFMEMELPDHFSIAQACISHVASQNQYAGLLIAHHFAALYEGRLAARRDPETVQQQIRAFVARVRDWQDHLLASLRALDVSPNLLSSPALMANVRLLQVCDDLSLTLCVPFSDHTLHAVPTQDGSPIDINIRWLADRRLTLDPWPFASSALNVYADAYQLEQGSFPDHDTYRSALAAAQPLRLYFNLVG